MDGDTSLVVNLEVTVPRIVLPACLNRHASMQAQATSQYSESNESEDVEQVRLVLIGLQQDPALHLSDEQPGGRGDVWTRMAHSIRFRVFHVTVPVHAQPFLFQVLRRCNKYFDKRRPKGNNLKEDNVHVEQLYVTNAMAFSVEFRSSSEIVETNLAISTPTLIPGLNRVVIYLDNEGTPAGYSIDGAES